MATRRRKPRKVAKRPAFDPEQLARDVEEARARIRHLVPEIDDQTLVTILASVLRPFGTGKRFLLKRQPDGSFIL